jgi:predicted TPR repeat methyltransferase
MNEGDGEQVQMSLNDALALAIRVHREGQLGQAREIYEQILDAAPKNPDALHYLGLLHFQSGDVERAIPSMQKALLAAPAYVEAFNNLGNIFQSIGELEEAERCYRRVIELRPGHTDSHNNLGVVLKSQGRLNEAVDAYRQALALDNGHAQTHHNIGNVLRNLGHSDEAVTHFRAAIEYGLDTPDTRHALAAALHQSGRLDEARSVLEDWLKQDPDDPIAIHLQAAFQIESAPARASDAYVKTVFDAMAGHFDEHLGDLGYRAHTLVVEAMKQAVGDDSGGLSILDAGCGTGLCGPLVEPLAQRLVGIDLSPKMLRRARAYGVYDELVEGELTEFLLRTAEPYQVIICADTLCYFGDLAEVTAAAAAALQPDGCFIFTLEHWSDEGGKGFLLHPHGRYSHGRRYVEGVVAGAGLEIERLSVETLRQEVGVPVHGLLVTARRSRQSSVPDS